MAAYRKLSRPSDQRQAMLRGLVTTLIWNGKVQTTEARAKEVRRIAERMITLAMKECDNNITVKKTTKDGKEIEVRNDAPSKLHARRQIMSYLYDVQPTKGEKESKSDYLAVSYTHLGVGEKLHEQPDVLNYGRPGKGPRLVEGMTLAIEPMINMGARQVYMADNEWTVVTADHLPSSHYENSIAITPEGPMILTLPDGPMVYQPKEDR